jgi:hypothetical protein
MCAGHSADGDAFVTLFDRVATGVESMPAPPVCWFLAGAGLLDIGDSGRRGVDLPVMRGKFAPHRLNFQRLQRSQLDWRLLCPGPMVEGEGLGLARLRIARERLPVEIPSFARLLPSPLLLPVLARRIPEMIVPYEDAAALMLAHLAPGGEFSRARVGIALPAGMRGRKDGWTKPPQ